MKTILKRAGKILGTIIILWIVAYLAMAINARSHATDVDKMCGVTVGAPIDKVFQDAVAIGFSDHEIVLSASSNGTERPVDRSEISLVKAGTLTLIKTVLPPFGRRMCFITFMDRAVVATRISTLD